MMFNRYKKLIGVCLTGILMLGFGFGFAFGFAQEASADWTNGKFDSAMDFNGTSDFIFAGDTEENVKTIGFWIKADTTTEKIIDLDAGTHYVQVISGTATTTGFIDPTIYVDGVAGTTIDTNWHFVAITTDTAIDANSVYLGRVFTGGANYYFDGVLDDVKFYDRVLTAREIAEHYRQDAPSVAQGGTISANSANTALTIIQSSTGDIINVLDNGTEVFTILDGGNVGIGDTAPSAKLSVVQSGTGKIIQAQGNRNLSYEMALYSEGELELRNTLYSDMKFIDIAGYYNGSSFTTTTDEINSYQGTAQTILAGTNDFFYWGCTSTDGFTRLYFDLNAVATTSLALDWEYSTGASTWSRLQGTTTTDDTARTFTGDGNIDWTIPGDWATTTSFGGIATSTDAHYLVRVSTDTTGWTTAPTAYYATLSRYGSDFVRFTTDSDDKFRIDKDGDVYIAGKLGIATTTPAVSAHIVSTSEQLRLAHDVTNYSQFFTDATGDLRILSTGEDIKMVDGNVWICSGSGGIDSPACPTITLAANGGYLVVENNIYIDNSDTAYRNYKKICPTGYIWVDGSAKHGTLPGFCVMKYEAKCDWTGDGAGNGTNSGHTESTSGDCSAANTCEDDNYGTWHNDNTACSGGSKAVVSTAAGAPIAYISQTTAQDYCRALGDGYHLMTDQEWMTIAEDALYENVNWCDLDGSNCDNAPGTVDKYLAAGHNDDGPSEAQDATTTDANACYATVSKDTAVACGTGATQKRTHTLFNDEVIWDFAGNVWEWTDFYIYETDDGVASSTANYDAEGIGGEMPKASKITTNSNYSEYTQITDYQGLKINPPRSDWDSGERIGKIYTDVDEASPSGDYHAFLRGGCWSNTSYAGVFALSLRHAPSSVDGHIGFRCSR